MSRVRFTVELVKRGQTLCFELPEAASSKLVHRGRVPISGSLNSFPVHTSIFPDDDGGHFMTVSPDIQRMAGVKAGDHVKVILDLASQPRTVEVPGDLARALERVAAAQEAFERLAYSHQREYVEWIEEAKRPETRARRIEKTVERLRETPAP